MPPAAPFCQSWARALEHTGPGYPRSCGCGPGVPGTGARVPGRQGAPGARAQYQRTGSAVAEQDSFITPLGSTLELELGNAGA